jgi:hypothetical protein
MKLLDWPASSLIDALAPPKRAYHQFLAALMCVAVCTHRHSSKSGQIDTVHDETENASTHLMSTLRERRRRWLSQIVTFIEIQHS